MFYLLAIVLKFDLNTIKANIVLDQNVTIEGRFKQTKKYL